MRVFLLYPIAVAVATTTLECYEYSLQGEKGEVPNPVLSELPVKECDLGHWERYGSKVGEFQSQTCLGEDKNKAKKAYGMHNTHHHTEDCEWVKEHRKLCFKLNFTWAESQEEAGKNVSEGGCMLFNNKLDKVGEH